MPSEHKISRDDDYGNAYQGEENLDSLGLPNETGSALEESQEEDTKVDAGGQHRYGQDNLRSRIGIERNACIPGAKTAGATCGHGVCSGIEPSHSGEFQGKECNERQSDIGDEHPVGKASILFPGQRFACDIGNFGPGQSGFVGLPGEHREKGDDAYAAHPGCGNAPQLQAARKRLDVIQDGGSGSSKTGNAFKECIDGSKLPAVEEEGQHPKQTGK